LNSLANVIYDKSHPPDSIPKKKRNKAACPAIPLSGGGYTRGAWDLGVNVRHIDFMARRNDE